MLADSNLPVADLPPNLDNFWVAIVGDVVVGVAGLEIYGNYGLLRSVAVEPQHRGLGLAGKLVDEIISVATVKKLTDLYLLTETAAGYFKNKGFEQINRELVVEEIKTSSEFKSVCPASAIVMKKHI